VFSPVQNASNILVVWKLDQLGHGLKYRIEAMTKRNERDIAGISPRSDLRCRASEPRGTRD